MTYGELAKRHGLTMEELQEERMAFLLCEGYGDDGKEHPDLFSWLARKPVKESYEPDMGGRGMGDYGNG